MGITEYVFLRCSGCGAESRWPVGPQGEPKVVLCAECCKPKISLREPTADERAKTFGESYRHETKEPMCQGSCQVHLGKVYRVVVRKAHRNGFALVYFYCEVARETDRQNGYTVDPCDENGVIQIPNPDAPDETEPQYPDDK